MLTMFSRSFSDTRGEEKILNGLMHMVSAEVEPRTLPSHWSSYTTNNCPLCGLFSATFSKFVWIFFFGHFAVYSSPTHSAEVLPRDPKRSKAATRLIEKIRVRRAPSDTGCSAVRQCQSVNLTLNEASLNTKHTSNKVLYRSVNENLVTGGSQETNAMFLLKAWSRIC